jgi:ubiquinone/menaquinone biosynthesis C-methylase UbiE
MDEVKQLRRRWEDLAQLDPMWAIASDPEKQYGKWDHVDFFETGRAEVQEILDLVEGLGIEISRGVALDFGCGIGRLTQALGEQFEICYGIDISATMIRLAREYNLLGERCRYIVNESADLNILGDSSIDFIYTAEVLQHVDTSLMERYLIEFVRVIKTSGAIVFHIPIGRRVHDSNASRLRSLPKYHPERVSNKIRSMLLADPDARFYGLSSLSIPKQWLYSRCGLAPRMEMNYLPEERILDLMDGLGMKVVHVVRENYRLESDMVNALFVVTSA